MESHRRGDLTEAIVVAELKRREIPVSVPFGDNERYDIVAESDDGRLWKLQVKTGWYTEGRVEFHGKSQHTNSKGNTYERYDGDVDFFCVYCEAVDGLYLVPEGDVGSKMFLRVEEPAVELPSINWADDYAFDARWPPE